MAKKPKQKDPAAVELGRKGGIARMKALTKSERSAIGRQAIAARWAKRTPAERSIVAKRAAKTRWERWRAAQRAGKQPVDQVPAA